MCSPRLTAVANATSSTNGIPFTSRGIGVSLGRQFEGMGVLLIFARLDTELTDLRVAFDIFL